MARCKLTNMNLRNIRKTREYQCLLIDLVKTGVVGKSAAESLLGYTIPEGLLGDTTPATPGNDDNGGEEEAEPRMITIVAEVLDDSPKPSPFWDSFEYDLNNGDTVEDVLSAANDHWPDGGFSNSAPFNVINELVESPRGIININDVSYTDSGEVEPPLEPGMVVYVWYKEENTVEEES